MPRKKKRRLTKEEVEEIRVWMENSPQHRKPNIRQIARRYGVNQPSVVKSLEGWRGIRRGRPEPPAKTELGKILEESKSKYPIEIEGYTTQIDTDKLRV